MPLQVAVRLGFNAIDEAVIPHSVGFETRSATIRQSCRLVNDETDEHLTLLCDTIHSILIIV